MKSSQLFIAFIASFLFSQELFAISDTTAVKPESIAEISTSQKKKHINFFIVSKRKKGSLDLASRFNVLRSKLKSLFRRKKFVAIVAGNSRQMSAKVQYRLKKYDRRIGTIWFDSHGMYKKGYSLFFIGHDEYSYKSIQDSSLRKPLEDLSKYADDNTKIVIGSCYGGATYVRASIDYRDTTRMNGDSLMIAVGKIFSKSTVFASESWVMTKPGLFLRKPAVTGYPGRKLFLDKCYQPAWENAGKWNMYHAEKNCFQSVNPIALDIYGNLVLRGMAYTAKEKVKKDLARNLGRLEPNLYK